MHMRTSALSRLVKNQRVTVGVIAGISLIPIACSDSSIGSFSVDESLGETRVQGVGFVNILPLTLSELNLNIEEQEAYEAEDFDFVTKIRMKELSLSVTDSSDDPEIDSFEDGNEDNFDFIESMNLYIQASIDGEQRKEQIAFLSSSDSQIASETRQLTFSMTGLNILDYVEAAGGYTVLIEGSGNVPPDDVIFDGEVQYSVSIGFR